MTSPANRTSSGRLPQFGQNHKATIDPQEAAETGINDFPPRKGETVPAR